MLSPWTPLINRHISASTTANCLQRCGSCTRVNCCYDRADLLGTLPARSHRGIDESNVTSKAVAERPFRLRGTRQQHQTATITETQAMPDHNAPTPTNTACTKHRKHHEQQEQQQHYVRLHQELQQQHERNEQQDQSNKQDRNIKKSDNKESNSKNKSKKIQHTNKKIKITQKR